MSAPQTRPPAKRAVPHRPALKVDVDHGVLVIRGHCATRPHTRRCDGHVNGDATPC